MSYYSSDIPQMILKKTTSLHMVVFVTLLCITLSSEIKSQHFDFGIEYGYSSYFGDLSPFTAIPSTTRSAASKGYYVGYGNRYGTVFLNYTTSEIYASDSKARFENRKKRNLSFRSPILEYGLTTEINIPGIIFNRYTRLQPMFITGINVFYFNPYTIYQGQRIDLQPLGTEGQGTAEFPDRKKYSLTQVSIPIGAGIKYQLTDKLWIGCGAKLRLTFTDYLDDVSKTYVDPEVLSANHGALSAKLSYRADEIDPNYNVQVGTPRGNPNENDWYMTTYLTIGLRFKEEKNYRKRRSRKNSKRRVVCPSF